MKLIARALARLRSIWRREGKLAFLRRVLGPLLSVSYRRWSANQDPTAAQLARQRAEAQALPHRPLLTVLLSAGDAPPTLLDASIRSVVGQSYDRWELRIATGIPASGEARGAADAWARLDARISVHDARLDIRPVRRAGNTDEFILFLGVGDMLAPHAFFEVARVLNEDRQAQIVYFDEDAISAAGQTRSSPSFRPDWSPEMLLSVNYLAHAVIKRTLLDVGVDPGAVAGGAPWDLTLRCSERTREIRHIPKVLYHLRAGRPSAAASPEDLRALERHCRRLGIANPSATVVPPGIVRLTWPAGDHRISIVIPNKDRAALLRRCVTSLLERSRYGPFEVLIVDNGSTEAATRHYYAGLGREPRVRVIDYPGPFNFSAVNNAGVRAASGDLLLFLNNDTESVNEDWLEEMVRWAERREIGAVGAKLLYPDHTIQHAGIVVGLRGLAHHIYRQTDEAHTDLFGSVDWYRNYLAVTGACLMMRRDVFDQVGGFDERYQVAFGDIELCLRVHRHGYRIVYTPFATLRHDEGATRGSYYPEGDTLRALEHLREFAASGDPYFHPSLSHESLVPMLPRRGDRPREALLSRHLARVTPK